MHYDPSLQPFFSPSGVAVVGASQDPTKLGYGLARNLVQSNYQGVVHLVNQRGGSLFGRPLYPSISQVPDPVDMAILLIPAKFIPQILHDCGERGLRAAIISSGGFREIGGEGAALEAECLHIAHSFGIRLLGPNSVGLLDTHLPMNATFLPPPGPLLGDVAFISHSGAICAAVIDWARGQGFGLSRLVSLGNQSDVNETDILAAVADDPFTKVLTLYLEGVGDGRRFVGEAGKIKRQKPIIALKVGRYTSGQRAVASHTGALSGEETAFNAAFRRAGVIRADTSEEMFDWARALAWCPLPTGRAVAVLTNAGGPGVTAADALESNGMSLANLTENTKAKLKLLLPPAASLHNPVDMLASASPDQYAQSLRYLLEDTNVNSAMVILPPPPMYTAGAVAKALIPVIHSADKPVVIALMGERLIQEAVEHFRAARVPEYRFPERAASALAVLVQHAENLLRDDSPAKVSSRVDSVKACAILDSHMRAKPLLSVHTLEESQAGTFLLPSVVKALLECYNIQTPAIELACSPNEAVEIANQMGYPVALKIASPEIIHKTDVNGVLLDLKSATEVIQGYQQLVNSASARLPRVEILGGYLQPMIPSGQDVIVGAIQDPQFGALVMFGSGGTEVEGLNDVAFALAPVTEEEVNYLLESTWAGRKLSGYRSLAPADREAVIEAIIHLAQLAADLPQLAEIEINPLRVLPKGQGVFAIDVRARVISTLRN